VVKTLYDYIRAEESGEPIDAATRLAVEESCAVVADAIRAMAERMRPGTVAGDIWELVRPSASEKERTEAVERLASGPFKHGIIGKRAAALGYPKTRRSEILSSIIVALHSVTGEVPRDAARALRLRFEDELARVITGKGRTGAELAETALPDEPMSEFILTPDLETQILVRESLAHFQKSNPHLAAVIEALISDAPLKEVAERRGLAYDSVRQAKARHGNTLKKYFS